MARLSGYYDFSSSTEPQWVPVAFPDGDKTSVPDKPGIYRFIGGLPDDKQTLYTGIAPSMYGTSLRACFGSHVLMKNDKSAELYALYCKDRVGFEHCQCSKEVAMKQKQILISNLNPPFNMDIKIEFGNNSNKNPFNS